MLSVLLGCAFISRQLWGLLADQQGGLKTVIAGSFCQMLAIVAFSATRSEPGLFAVAALFGFGFSGIIPAYSVVIRDLFPSKEASWRIPLVLLTAMSGMAFGSWFAGALFDTFLSYHPAFVCGVLFNAANIVVIACLVGHTARSPNAKLVVTA